MKNMQIEKVINYSKHYDCAAHKKGVESHKSVLCYI